MVFTRIGCKCSDSPPSSRRSPKNVVRHLPYISRDCLLEEIVRSVVVFEGVFSSKRFTKFRCLFPFAPRCVIALKNTTPNPLYTHLYIWSIMMMMMISALHFRFEKLLLSSVCSSCLSLCRFQYSSTHAKSKHNVHVNCLFSWVKDFCCTSSHKQDAPNPILDLGLGYLRYHCRCACGSRLISVGT